MSTPSNERKGPGYAASRALLETLDVDLGDALAGFMLNPGMEFFAWLTKYLQDTLQVDIAFIGEVSDGNSDHLETLHIREREQVLETFSFQLEGTPAAGALLVEHYACIGQADEVFPGLSARLGGPLHSYIHMAIKDLNGLTLGVVAVVSRAEIDAAKVEALLQVFRSRMGAELMRRRAIASLILASSTAVTAQASLERLLVSLAQATQVRRAFVAEREIRPAVVEGGPDRIRLATMALYEDGQILANTAVEAGTSLLSEIFPREGLVVAEHLPQRCTFTAESGPFVAESFLGYQVYSTSNEILGQVALLHDRPLPPSVLLSPLPQVLLAGISNELRRIDYENQTALLRERLMEAEHRDNIGSLASGIAHDFNNIVFAIAGQAHLVDRVNGEDPLIHDQMSVIASACDQASGLCDQLMVYAGRQVSKNKSDIDLNQVVTECKRIAEIFTKGKMPVCYQLSQEPLLVHARLTQLQQVVMNLLKNASDVVSKQGKVVVRTRLVQCNQEDFKDAVVGEDDPAGSYALLEVEDDGPGIPEVLLRRIFTPFFSTKDVGHGMGLAVVLSGAKAHGAAILVDSEIGRGSRFQIFFPIAEAKSQQETERPIKRTRRSGPRSITPGHRLLLIDDDDLVRQTTASILESEDFEVTCAASGQEGLAIIESEGTAIAAVVLDYFMPQMLGDEVLERLRKLAPDLPVVLVSGNVRSTQLDEFSEQPTAFLSKPVSPAMLVQTLSTVISEREAALAKS